jgi:sterol desaturase/sphingolipid hydroxylase (fatty acid hydroxylase superfamily)
VLFHAFIPLLLQQLYVHYTKHNLSPFAAFFFYAIALKAIAIRELNLLRRLAHIYGFLDGDEHERDQVPDHSVLKVLMSLTTTAAIRPLLSVILSYRTNETPASINWLFLPLEIGLYQIVLDFWFYWYHRLMHQVDGLWKYHHRPRYGPPCAGSSGVRPTQGNPWVGRVLGRYGPPFAGRPMVLKDP